MSSYLRGVRPEVLAALLVALVAVVLGATGYVLAGVPLADIPYRCLQLFAAEGDAVDGVHVGWLLGIARVLAPVTAVVAVVLGLREVVSTQARRRRIAARTGHVIVCGDDVVAEALARNLRGEAPPKDVVLVHPNPLTGQDLAGLDVVAGDAREPATLHAAGLAGADALYACAEHSAVNAATALVAGRLRAGSPRPLQTFAQVRSDELVDALRVQRLGAATPRAVTLDFFVVADIAARAVVEAHPPGDGVPVVIGFGRLGRAVLRALIRTPGASPPREVVVVTVAGQHAVAAEAARLGAAGRGWSVRHGEEGDGNGRVYVCLADEDDGVSTALRLTSAAGRSVVLCLARYSPFGEALAAHDRLHVVGVLDTACQAGVIEADSIIGRAARAIHEGYRSDAIGAGNGPLVNPSAQEWARLPPHLKESNYAQAEGIGAKLDAIGATLDTRPSPVPFTFTPVELELLAHLEHDRWMDERLAAGFVYGPHRDDNHHPDLVDWDRLPGSSKEKDVAAVRRLPEMLATEGLYLRRSGGVA